MTAVLMNVFILQADMTAVLMNVFILQADMTAEEKRQEHQKELAERMNEEAKERIMLGKNGGQEDKK